MKFRIGLRMFLTGRLMSSFVSDDAAKGGKTDYKKIKGFQNCANL